MDSALEAAVARFVARNPTSQKLHEESLESLPGGNTRTLLHTAPFPIFMARGEGHKLYDEDGHEYVDFVAELTAGIYGHSHPRLKQALSWAMDNLGLQLGAQTTHEQRYATLICARFGLDRVRFTNSGTEANLHCVAAARRFTGRRRIVAFRGGYHGGVLSFGAGAGAEPNVVDRDDWEVLQYNDVRALRDAFERGKGTFAAVILEVMQGSAGGIQATEEFLRAIREVTQKDGALMIFDEVITSRLAPGGLQSTLSPDLKPDLTTLGKYLGGGMPFGAFGGRADVMAVFDPRSAGSLNHSGTFQNNTLMLHAGFVAMSEVYTPEAAISLNARGDDLRERLAKAFEGTRLSVTGLGSFFCIHATTTGLRAEEMHCRDAVAAVEDNALKRLFWLEMIEAGFWVQSRGTTALSLAMTDEAIDSFVEEVGKFCGRHHDLIKT